MSKRPGGELATRPLHFIWIADGSGSMAADGKIQARIMRLEKPYLTCRKSLMTTPMRMY